MFTWLEISNQKYYFNTYFTTTFLHFHILTQSKYILQIKRPTKNQKRQKKIKESDRVLSQLVVTNDDNFPKSSNLFVMCFGILNKRIANMFGS